MSGVVGLASHARREAGMTLRERDLSVMPEDIAAVGARVLEAGDP